MPTLIPIVNITLGDTITQSIGTATTAGAFTLANESPYGLMVSAGAAPRWIPALTIDRVDCAGTAFSGNISITAVDYLSYGASAPSSIALINVYAPGEPITGTYPAALSRLTNVGNTVNINSATNTLEQDLLTPFVLSGLIPSKDGTVANQLDVTAGIALLRQSDSSLLRQSLVAATFFTTTHSATYFLDLNPDASWSWGTSHSTQSNYMTIATVTTDGSGDISVVTNSQPTSTTLLSGYNGTVNAPANFSIPLYLYFSNAGFPGALGEMTYDGANLYLYSSVPGTLGGVIVATDIGGTTSYPFAAGTFSPLLTAAMKSWIDGAGVLHSSAPVKLAAGNQETGACGGGGVSAGVYGTTGSLQSYFVNFKTTLSSAPTSISLTVASSTNINASYPTVDTLTVYGFDFNIASNAAGLYFWHGTYTTVGNCLLAVDAAASTFDHHCDACGNVSLAMPFTLLRRHADGVTPALAYACPVCKAEEHFNVALTAADEADTTPQGTGKYATTRGAQASLIRQLMAAVGLDVAA